MPYASEFVTNSLGNSSRFLISSFSFFIFHFSSPWGLLALLSVPIILFLHFFRERRMIRKIGGLHLWEFASIKLPSGRRFDKLIKNLPLLFQLLAAILLSLLIAGLDIPQTGKTRHYTIILDDSLSMQAAKENSPVIKAKKLALDWADKKDRFTVIASGLEPRVIAGPFASSDELAAALDKWEPQSPRCELDKAVNLASKFVTGEEKILFITDDAIQAEPFDKILATCALGSPVSNSCISLADRVRIYPGKDKVFVSLQVFDDKEKEIAVSARIQNQIIFQEKVNLVPDKVHSLSFETDGVEETLEIFITDDDLSADNSVILPPVIIKPVYVNFSGFGDFSDYFKKALLSVPYTILVEEPDRAHLVFTTQKDFTSKNANLRIYLFPEAAEPENSALAQGRDIVFELANPLTENLSFDGVLWPYVPLQFTPVELPLISHQNQPLLFLESQKDILKTFHVNLLWDRTNIYRHPAWPTLVFSIVEECREVIPGLNRSSFRVGEDIALGVEPDPKRKKSFSLVKDKEPFAEYEEIPAVLSELNGGRYEIFQEKDLLLASFSVNFFSPDESNLMSLNSRKVDLTKLLPATLVQARRNMLLHYALLISILVFTGLSWVYHELYH
ncbi:BatA and WFA domain-containing protein [Candidatus Sumerlaeota bacterium]|nr:BatA and WFA domain-containing protein [Candidatus Sumerlaeota bacterium]